MSGLVVTLIVLVCIAAYCGVTGAVASHFIAAAKVLDGCTGRPSCHMEGFHRGESLFKAAFWPVTLPIGLGMRAGNRDEHRRADELAAAKHRADLAEQQAREDEAEDRRYRIAMREWK